MPLALNVVVFQRSLNHCCHYSSTVQTELTYDSYVYLLCRSAWELCHNHLHYSEGKKHVLYFQQTLTVSDVMVAVDAAHRGCEEQRRMINRVLCISRRIFSLLTPVLQLTSTFWDIIPFLHDCNLCNLLGEKIPRLSAFCYTLRILLVSALTMAMCTPTHPDEAKTLTIVAMRKPNLGSTIFYLYNCVTQCFQFEDLRNFLIPCYSM
jgi:hypothetical protein